MAVSVFDLFKIGIGPSSSHTVGPMRAARAFAQALADAGLLPATARVQATLYGSLAATGKGHGSDKAIVLGLLGHAPDTVDVDAIPALLQQVRGQGRLALLGTHALAFDERRDVLLRRGESLPLHANGLQFSAYGADGRELLAKTVYSVGGGFVVGEEVLPDGSRRAAIVEDTTALPCAFHSGAELLALCAREGCSIAALMRRNERAWRSDADIDAGLLRLWQAMQACIERGCRTEGTLPGGFKVQRRAPALYRKLTQRPEAALNSAATFPGGRCPPAGPIAPERESPILATDPLQVLDWVNLYALAVNEENAAGGRVVTAPTNGAAGIVPAVLCYHLRFACPEPQPAQEAAAIEFLLTAAAIGLLYKENASISGAEVGCQGEVGVACSMAAGALAAVMGGTPAQVENAAEIGMEHHLGLTCDPVGGLVQIPCIERNAIAAVQALNAARMALRGDGTHHVSLDQVIKTMRETGADMMSKYKETARGGLAVNIIEC